MVKLIIYIAKLSIMKMNINQKTTLLIFAVMLLVYGTQGIGYADNTGDPHWHDDSTTRSIAENSSTGTNVGAAVTAHDFTAGAFSHQYILDGTDKASFNISDSTGQITSNTTLDYETKDEYTVTVKAQAWKLADGLWEDKDSITVTINVTNVNEAPTFPDTTDTTLEVTKYTLVGTNIGAPISATDEDGDTLTYTLGGTDAASFDFETATGQLKTLEGVTFDRTTQQSPYMVTVTASDSEFMVSTSVGITVVVTPVCDRTPAVRDAIVAEVLGVTDCADVTETHLAAITSLNLANKGITALKAGDFDGLTALTSLDLTNNQISTLPSGVFGELTALTTLDLTINRIRTLPAGVFDEITALTWLSLNNNQIITLPAGVFDKITALTTLRLNDNQLRMLDEDVFDGLTALTTLRLSGNQLRMLDEDVFDGLTALTTLTLSGNQLSTLDEDVFDGLTALTTLLLDANRLISLEEDVFDGLTALATLRLTSNKISPLPAGVFEGLTALTTLTLDGADLTALPEDVFEGLTALTTLTLDGNDLTALPADVFEGLTALTTLTLPRNDITALPADVFEGLTTLSVLRLNHNKLSTLPAGVFEGLTALTRLYLNNNVVNPLPLTVSLKQVAEGEFKATAHTGAPFGMVLPVTVTNGTIDGGATMITVPIGNVESGSLTVTRTTGTTAAVTVTIGTLPGLPSDHTGYALSKSSDLPLKVISNTSNNAPEFTDGTETTRLVAENTAAGENIGDPVAATDDDTTDTLTYRLNGTDADSFDIVSTTGQLQTKAALDRETKSSYSVTVVVTDGNGGINSIAVTITVTEANYAPEFTDGDSTTRSVAENTEANINIGAAVTATDPNVAGTNTDVNPETSTPDTLTYTLSGTTDQPNDYQTFDIDTATGQLKTKDALDYETKTSYKMTVSVSDGTLSDTITVTINITNVNEAPTFPATTDTTLEVTKHTPEGTDIGDPVAATDPDVAGTNTDVNLDDATVDALTYTLGGTDAASFDIDSDTGQLKTKTGVTFDRTTQSSYMVTVTASDGEFMASTPVGITVVVTPVCDRTEQVRDAIVAEVPGVTDCADVTETHLAAIMNLNLSNKSITALKAGDFDGLTALTELSLNDNQISSLPASVFDELTALTTLNLNDNQLSSLPAGVFDELTALTNLYLGVNRLSSLPAEVFDELTALTTLNLNDNQLSSLPAGVFDELTALTSLDLNSNPLNSLPAGVFDKLTALTNLNLGVNRLSSLPADVFDGQTAFTQLLLYSNQLSTLPAGVFDGLTALTTLWLHGNTVNPLPLTVSLKQVASGEFKATAHTGAPFGMVLPLTVTNGSIDGGATTITIPIGNVESGSLTVTRTTGTTATVTVNIGTLPGLPSNHQGYALTKSSDLPLKVISEPSNNAPEFTDGTETTREVAQNTAAGQNIGDPVAATDDDTTDTLTYRLNGTDADSFDIVSTTGQLKTKAPLDYSTKNSYSVTVVVTDGNGGIDSIAVTINVTDTNNAPEFNDGTETTTREVDENTPSDTAFDDPVEATDDDSSDTLTYTLSGTDAASFDIVSSSGQLKTKAPLDYETDNSYAVTVSVSDGEGGSDSIDVTINITNVNEAPTFPDTTDTTLEVTKYTPVGTDIGDPVVATDPDVAGTNTDVNLDDANVDALTYTLGGTDAASFDFETATGQLKTLAGVTFDRTTKLSYMVTVTASDGEFMTPTSVVITVVVTPVCDRTPVVRDAIVAEVPGVTDCADVTETHLAAITGPLNLANKSITALKAGDFDGLTALTELDLNNNQIRRLPSGVFDELTALTTLRLSGNQLRLLDEDVFDGLTALTGLFLTGNQLITLDKDVFDGLTALTTLLLDENRLISLDKDLFDGLTALATLRLTKNKISPLPAGVFEGLTALTTLNLDGADLTALPEDVFEGLTALTTLNLDDNDLTALPAEVFEGLTALTTLTLPRNDITALPADVFEGLTTLSVLRLNDNKLSTLPAGVFDSLTALTQLFLHNNTVNPLPLTVSLKQVASGEFKATAHTGAPFGIVLPVTVTNGTIDGTATTITVPTGNVESGSLTVTRTTGTTAVVTVNIGTLPGLPTNHTGYALTKSSDLPLKVISEPSNNAPEFTDGTEITRLVAENTEAGQNFGSAVAATDDDSTDTLTYRLNGTDADSFDIVSTTGQLKTKAALDRETKSSYSVTVVVTDGNGGINSIAVTINVTEANNAPEFTDGTETTTREVDENTAAGTNIGAAVSATDPNVAGTNTDANPETSTPDTLTYTLSGTTDEPNDYQTFDIDTATGQLKIKDALDYETKTSYKMTVSVSDGTLSDPITVTINITNVNEAPTFPATTDTTLEVTKYTPVGTDIGDPVAATDPDVTSTNTDVNLDDANVDALTYTLGGTDAASFDIDSETGQLKTKTGVTFDRTTQQSSYMVTVTASDGEFMTPTSVVITVVVTPVCDRTEQVRDAIVAEVPGVTDCADVTETHLAAIVNLNLANKSITALKAGDFDGLTALETLNLSRNQISTLTAGVFDELTALTELDLYDNQISTLTAGVFDKITALTHLYLSNNQISTLTAGVFDELTALTELDLSNNQISTLTAGVFDELTALTELYLSYNQISTLTAGVFDELTALETLDLSNNQISTLTARVFDKLTALTALDLSYNQISTLTGGLIELTALETLDLSNNQISTLPALVFDELTALTTLDLHSSQISTLTPGVFDGLTALETLDLYENQISSLPARVFDKITALTTLDLYDNQIRTLPAGVFDKITALTQLRLNSNQISTLPDGVFEGLTALETLDLNVNQISTLPAGVFDELTALTTLHLSYNQLSTLPAGVFNGLTALTSLLLNNNTVDPLPLTVSLKQVAEREFKATAHTGAPFEMVLPVTVTNGTLDGGATMITIPIGNVESGSLTVTRTIGTTAAVTVTIGTLPGLPANHTGYALSKSSDLPLKVISNPSNNAPEFTDGTETTRSVAENTATGQNIGDPVAATDDDTTDTLTYRLNGTDADSFDIVSTTGQLKTKAALNYATKNSYSVTVVVTDGNGGIDSIAVTINVTEANNVPEFTDGTKTTREVDENTASNTAFGDPVAATDDDTTDTLTYTLGGTDAASFDIVSSSGQLKTKAALDYATKNSYSVTVSVSDGTDTDSIAVTINVTNVNEAPTFPATTDTTLEVTKHTPEGTDIGDPVAATDPDVAGTNTDVNPDDATVDALTYTLGGTDVASFDIDSDTGQLKTKTGVAFDRTTQSSYMVTVTASDGEFTASTSVGITVVVTPVCDRTEQVRDAIVAEVPGVTDCADVTETHLAAITSLSPFNKSITALKAGDFDGLTALTELSLNRNQITTLPAGVFDEITALTTLRLDSNQITTLPAGVFDGLTALTELSLSHNQISTLPAGVFDKLTALTALYLHVNQISTLTAGVFDGLTALTTLTLYTNQISTLTAGVFDELTALTRLDLDNNQISTLPAGVFDKLTALTRLYLHVNQISTLPAGVFDELTALTTLSLYSNQISTLPAGVFDELTALTTLSLSRNQISTLPAGVFDKLTALTTLYLHTNQISTLTEEVFDGLTALTALYLHTNQISTLPEEVFDGLTALTALYLHKNQISTLPAGVFEGLTALTTLNLNNNMVEPLPLTVSLKQVAEGEFKATAHTGAPFEMVLPVTVTNGSIDGTATTITIPIGNVESGSLTVTRTTGTTAAVTVNIGTLPGLPLPNHTGYALTKSSDLPLKVISDTSNNAPEFTDGDDTTRDVVENTATDTVFGDPVTATDDNTTDTLTYRLNGTDADSFDIVSTTGQLKTKAALDRETKSSYSVTVVVTDGNGGIDSIAVTITVTEPNNAPEFTDGTETTRSVAEKTAAGEDIGSAVAATDDDSGDTLTYTLSGTDAASFDIVSSSGQLKTKSALDYEATKNSYSVTVSVSDGTDTDSIDVTINVTNVNEAPTFPGTTATRSVAENKATGTAIGVAVTATDPDVAGTNTDVNPDDATVDALTYTLGGTDAASFDIVSTSGQLQTKAALDYETDNSYSVTVTVSDGGTDTASVTVTINVTNVNEAPTFPATTATRSVAENTEAGINIGAAVAATDPDVAGTNTDVNPDDANVDLTYTLGGTDAASFDIVSTSGQLQTKAALDHETKASYSVTVTVSDGGTDTASVTVTISVTDVDETRPTVSITVPSGVQKGAFDVTVVFSKAVTGFVQSELVVTGTSGASITAWNPQTGSTDYKVTITPTSSGTAIFNVAANVAKDTADNQNTAATQQTVQVNLTRPTVIINVPSGVQNGVFDVTVAFNEVVTGFVQSELVVSGTSGASITAWNPQTGGTDYKATITPTQTGEAIFNVAANVAVDSGSNQNTAATQQTVQVDMTQPTVSITVPSGVQNSAFDVTVVFSEAVTGFVQSELVVTGTSGASITAWNPQTGGTDYKATITPTSSGTTIFNVAANVAVDSGSNQNTAATQQTVQVDMTSPTVSITVPSGVQNGAFDVTVVFSEAVTGFVQSELVVTGTSGASITAWNPQTGGTDYKATITPTSSGTAIFNVAANVAVDSGSNQNTAAIQQTVAIDLTQVVPNVPDTDTRPEPLMYVKQNGVEKRDQTVTFATFPGTFQLVMDFDRPVTGFERSELAVHRFDTGVTVTGWRVSSDRTVYTATVQVSHTGGVTFTVPANAAQAVDDGQGNVETKLTVIVKGDANQPNRAPVFSEGTRASRTVAENTPSSRNIGSPVTATDADGDTLTYLLSGTDASSFGIDVVTGQLQTQADLDYETKSSYTVTITVSDDISSTDALTDTITVTITVTDVDEIVSNNAPAFASDSTTRSVGENTTANQNIGSPVSATDPDNDTLTYSLGGDDTASFSIETSTGQLKTKAALDYETDDSYSVTVSVSDGRGGTDTINVTITVTDVDEAPPNRPPVFAADSTTRSVGENTMANQNIGSPVTATDEDGDPLTYSLGGDDAASFSIETSTGQLKTKAALDYETDDSYSVTVSVSDGRGGTDTITVTINVTDVDEIVSNNAPVFASDSTTRSVGENTTANQNIGSPVTATDEDGDPLTYSLGGDDAASFSIETSTGQLKTKAALDYETDDSYSVTVSVSDGRGGTDTINVTITVTDVDEIVSNNAPVFASDSTTRSVAENTTANQNIGSPVTATDEDGDPLTYSLGGDDAASFSIETSTGQLKTKAALDYETDDSYSVTVSVSDGRGGTDTINVTITVTDVDEAPPNRPPAFAADSTTRSIAETTRANLKIGEPVSATDADGNTLTYSLEGTDAASFSIETSTGQLKTKAALDRDTKSQYSVIVKVSDGKGGTDTITVTINILTPDRPEPLMYVKQNGVEEQDQTVKPGTFQLVMDFDQPVTGFERSELGVDDFETGAIITRWQKSTDGKDYTATVRVQNTGGVTFTVPANVAQAADDGQGNVENKLLVLVTDSGEVNVAPASGKEILPPDETLLLPNYPNPFNPETWIPYHLARDTEVQILIYNVRGTIVRRLALGHQSAGFYTNRSRAAHWDGRNTSGERVAAGIYFYQLRADTVTPLRKMVILK